MLELTTNQKGAIAEAAITKAAIEVGIDVYRPVVEGGRHDLVFGTEETLLRVQCKWAPVVANVVVVRCFSSRRTRSGLVKRGYTKTEVDAFAAYCAELDRCFFLPFAAVGESPSIHLRLAPARNNQRLKIRQASDFEFAARLHLALLGP